MRQGNYTEDTLRAAKIGLEKGHLDKIQPSGVIEFFDEVESWLMFFFFFFERDADRGVNDV